MTHRSLNGSGLVNNSIPALPHGGSPVCALAFDTNGMVYVDQAKNNATNEDAEIWYYLNN